ncbi:hypothetical protein LOK49_LG10G00781 [Camellia lanceoleosa]|uniref:Uncharacterized protein n=1 Tax=Camellia lanceoleosa TaxID=1840588 RepID=A0ACC0GCR2_9ERIC|nr:hypothetical protein LOK49_LG10G00781 [Camellia lanceoleosa]
MEAPPPAPPPLSSTLAAAATAAAAAYPDSVDSSPRSRNTDSWDEPTFPSAAPGGGAAKLRLMCSYGGHIVPRPHDKSLCYVGGDTRIIVTDRHSSLSDLTSRLSKTLLSGGSFTIKYQLPNEDLDSLISVTTDEDLENMIEEYDRLTANNSTQKSSRLRLFLFPMEPDSGSSIGSLLENSTKSEDWFLNALNGATRGGFSESASVNCLLGLDDDVAIAGNENSSAKGVRSSSNNNINKQGGGGGGGGGQDVHSVPDSPMLETNSSFGSASSSPSLANLPPIRVHVVEDQKATMGGGIEDQFSQMSVGATTTAVQKQDDGGFVVLSSPPTVLTTSAATAVVVPGGLVGHAGDYPHRVISDDERSEQGMTVGYRKLPQAQQQQQQQTLPPQSQPKPTGGIDLASPDSVSSDNSTTNPLSRQGPMIYQDPIVQNSSGSNRFPVNNPIDPNSRVQMLQVQDSGYLLPNQFDQQLNPQQLQQLNPQQQQYLQSLGGTHFIQHHPTGAMPMASYYPMYHPQQQPHHPLDQQYPVFYMAPRQSQAYNLPVQQQNYSENATTTPSSRPQTPPYNTARNVTSNTEMATGMYRTATGAAPSLVQVPTSQNQPQYVGFSQMHHPPQSVVAPTSAATGNYAYEFADPAHAQMYYPQHMTHQLAAAQYQTMTSGPAMVLHEPPAQLPTDNVKQQQQIRTAQP